jgi:RimJ/RimL family protein N-acetyltransferase
VSSDRLITQDRKRCADWVQARIPNILEWGDWYQAIAMERNGEIIAGAVYNHYNRVDIQIHIAFRDRHSLTRQCVRAAFGYPFNQLKCQRITAEIDAANTASRRFTEHIGFRYEGRRRRALPNGGDLVIYGLLVEECPWVRIQPIRELQDRPPAA